MVKAFWGFETLLRPSLISLFGYRENAQLNATLDP
jgi:hypothetical protein